MLPRPREPLLRLRPIDGPEREAVNILAALECAQLEAAEYEPPDPATAADLAAARLVFDAARLALRSGAGPFRSLGRLSVTPRPYQYVPLLMALRLDPVRLLIADDVGVGKTIEAGMVARELLDRGAVQRVGVLCAPHLCEQWAEELSSKFHIEAAVVQPSRMARLERALAQDESVFAHYPHLVCSIDFVKSDRYRRAFIDHGPDLIIVDEAHTAARPRGQFGSSQHRRFNLLSDLVQRHPERHVILATATPHSGVDESFRSLLGLLRSDFDGEGELDGKALARHLVQRQRRDLQQWLGSDTPFPQRTPTEHSYQLDGDYLQLFDDVLKYCRELVRSGKEQTQRQRVRYWAAVAILRCLLSSPASAAAMLQRRQERQAAAQPADGQPPDLTRYQAQIFDSSEDDQAPDYLPSAAVDGTDAEWKRSERERLTRFLRRAEELHGFDKDAKLRRCAEIAAELLRDGFSPIIYCRYIDTARYVADQLETHLRQQFPTLSARAVTGSDGDSDQRREIVTELATAKTRLLVATDCLSEGVNLQEHWNAVIHYDLPWNPNRLEQREGRVDRYGQPHAEVRAVTLFGGNNQIDHVVMRVLIEKARTIYERLGIHVPAPLGSEEVLNAVIEDVLHNRRADAEQLRLDLSTPEVSRMHTRWDQAADQQASFHAAYAQHELKPQDVERELQAIQPIFGNDEDLQRFCLVAAQRLANPDYEELAEKGRNHPEVERLAHDILAQAFAPDQNPNLSRCGAIATDAVDRRTALLLLRLRYTINEDRTQLFAEEIVPAAFRREGGQLVWLDAEQSHELLRTARPTRNLNHSARIEQVEQVLHLLQTSGEWWQELVQARASDLHAAHARLREQTKGPSTQVEPHQPDMLGCYVFVPDGTASPQAR